jgi:hypothetical protein
MATQLDRIEQKLDGLIKALTQKQSPFDRDDDAPPKFVPVPGTELVLGPRPYDATDLALWLKAAKNLSAVTTVAPEVIASGIDWFIYRTGFVPPAYATYQNQDVVVLRTGIRNNWVVPFDSFVGSNVEGVIRAYLDDAKKVT